MANIHGLRDQPQNNNDSNIPQGQGPPDDVPFLMGYYDQNQKDPREENFFDFLRYSCCPQFKLLSFIVVTSLVQIGMFIVSLVNSDVIKGEFLQPSTRSLVELGAKYPYNMHQGQVWLFFTPVLLHGNFMHIFSNLVSQLIFGTELEKRLGIYKMATLYLTACVSGNLFSALISDGVSVGASTAIFGLLACLLGYLIINWDALARYGQMRCMVLCMLIMMILLNVMVGLGAKSTIDNYGHLGGFLAGLATSFILIKPIQPTGNHAMLKKIAITGLTVYFVVGFSVFFLVRHPAKLNY